VKEGGWLILIAILTKSWHSQTQINEEQGQMVQMKRYYRYFRHNIYEFATVEDEEFHHFVE